MISRFSGLDAGGKALFPVFYHRANFVPSPRLSLSYEAAWLRGGEASVRFTRPSERNEFRPSTNSTLSCVVLFCFLFFYRSVDVRCFPSLGYQLEPFLYSYPRQSSFELQRLVY